MEFITDCVRHAKQQAAASAFPYGSGRGGHFVLPRVRNQKTEDQISDEVGRFPHQSSRIVKTSILNEINKQEQTDRQRQKNGGSADDPALLYAEKPRLIRLRFQQMDQQEDACHKHNRPLRTREIFDERGQLVERVREEARQAPAQHEGLVGLLG